MSRAFGIGGIFNIWRMTLKTELQKQFERETGWILDKCSPIEGFNRIFDNFTPPNSHDIILFQFEYMKSYVKWLETTIMKGDKQ